MSDTFSNTFLFASHSPEKKKEEKKEEKKGKALKKRLVDKHPTFICYRTKNKQKK